MKVIRWILGLVVMALHYLTLPRRGKMRRLNLPIELRDVRADGRHRQDLINGGGKMKVPCLRIDHEDGHSEWMYESDEIVAYLSRRFPLEP